MIPGTWGRRAWVEAPGKVVAEADRHDWSVEAVHQEGGH